MTWGSKRGSFQSRDSYDDRRRRSSSANSTTPQPLTAFARARTAAQTLSFPTCWQGASRETVRSSLGTRSGMRDGKVAHPPFPKHLKYRTQGSSVPRQHIAHTASWFITNDSSNYAVRFELSEMLAKYLVRHSRHASSEIAKSLRAFAEPPKDHGFPPALDNSDSAIDGASAAFDIAQGFRIHAARFSAAKSTLKCLIVTIPDQI